MRPSPDQQGRTWPDLISEVIHGRLVLLIKFCIAVGMVGASSGSLVYMIVTTVLAHLTHH